MKLLLLASSLWLAPFFAPTDGLKRERLPPDVDFVVHFDLEGLKQTEIWKRFSESSERAEMEADIEEFHEIKERFGIDPFTDVKAMTLYKVETEEDPTVVLFSASAKIDAALLVLQMEKRYEKIVDSEVELHTWSEDDDERAFAYVHKSSDTERVVVLTSSRESALRAARILRGQEPSHAKSGTLLKVAPTPGSFLYLAAAEIPHLDEFTPASHLSGLAQGIQVDLGEAGGFLRGHMGVSTGSPADALNISNVLNGLVSLGRLAGHEAGEWMELLNGLQMGTMGSEVTLDFEYAIDRLMDLLESMDAYDDHGDGERDEEVDRPVERKVERIK